MPDTDFDDLLEGLDGGAREARLKLLTDLHDDGCSLAELRAAVAEDRLVLLPVDRALAGDERFTRDEIAERTGLSVEDLRTARTSLGLPIAPDDARVYGEGDLGALAGLAKLLEAGVDLEQVVELNRVIGRATNQIAAASRQMVADAVLQTGATEYEAALAAAGAARELTPLMAPVLAYAYEGHLRELLRSDVISASDIAAGRTAGAREMTVAFADLVGFTRLGEELPAEEVGQVVRDLERAADELVAKPVVFVKTIGDAVMLVSPKPDPLIEVALGLAEADLPALRVGVASGTALERSGDFYGSPVNQASRVTGVARPGTVLVTQAVRDQAGSGWSFSYAGEKKLKGVGAVKLHRVRRPGD